MRAKFINEIKRNIEGSELGPISIGNAALFKSYYKLNKRWPTFFNKDAKKLSEVFSSVKASTKLNIVKNRIDYYKDAFEEYSNSSLDDFICVNTEYKTTTTDSTIFDSSDELYSMFNLDDIDDNTELFNDEIDNEDGVYFSSLLKYNDKLEIGYIYIYVCEAYDKIFRYHFVKYK